MWIATKDAYPPAGQEVLVKLYHYSGRRPTYDVAYYKAPDYELLARHFRLEYYFPQGFYVYYYHLRRWEYLIEEVTHWMEIVDATEAQAIMVEGR